MNDIDKLKLIKTSTLSILIIEAGFIVWKQYYGIGVVLVIIGFCIEWKWYRCPHCNERLDTRMHIGRSTHCPYCGDILSLPKGYKVNK